MLEGCKLKKILVTGADGFIGSHMVERLVLNDFAVKACLLYTSPSPRDKRLSRMPSSA